jgi:hypothetical protein
MRGNSAQVCPSKLDETPSPVIAPLLGYGGKTKHGHRSHVCMYVHYIYIYRPMYSYVLYACVYGCLRARVKVQREKEGAYIS